jgi:hypothetical protein
MDEFSAAKAEAKVGFKEDAKQKLKKMLNAVGISKDETDSVQNNPKDESNSHTKEKKSDSPKKERKHSFLRSISWHGM